MTSITLENEIRFSKMCFKNLWLCEDIPLYGLGVGIAKETFTNRKVMPDRPIHEQNKDFARGVFNSMLFFKQLSE